MPRVFTSSEFKDPKHTPLTARCHTCGGYFGSHNAVGLGCPTSAKRIEIYDPSAVFTEPKETNMLLRNTLAEEGRPVDAPMTAGAEAARQASANNVNATEVYPRAQLEGIKFDQDKPRMDLIDPTAMNELAKVLTFGAQKYAAHNWRKGLHKSRLLGAALRHLFAYLGGEDKDPETGLSHAAHAMCCCMFILGLEHRTDLDDRHKEVTNG